MPRKNSATTLKVWLGITIASLTIVGMIFGAGTLLSSKQTVVKHDADIEAVEEKHMTKEEHRLYSEGALQMQGLMIEQLQQMQNHQYNHDKQYPNHN